MSERYVMSNRAELAQAMAEEAYRAHLQDQGEQHVSNMVALLKAYWSCVPATLFTDTGKYKYAVKLDYSAMPAKGYIDPCMNARRALHLATMNGTSEVKLSVIPDGWFLVVIDPPEGFPVMVRGGAR